LRRRKRKKAKGIAATVAEQAAQAKAEADHLTGEMSERGGRISPRPEPGVEGASGLG
jgi:hypothetical protein